MTSPTCDERYAGVFRRRTKRPRAARQKIRPIVLVAALVVVARVDSFRTRLVFVPGGGESVRERFASAPTEKRATTSVPSPRPTGRRARRTARRSAPKTPARRTRRHDRHDFRAFVAFERRVDGARQRRRRGILRRGRRGETRGDALRRLRGAPSRQDGTVQSNHGTDTRRRFVFVGEEERVGVPRVRSPRAAEEFETGAGGGEDRVARRRGRGAARARRDGDPRRRPRSRTTRGGPRPRPSGRSTSPSRRTRRDARARTRSTRRRGASRASARRRRRASRRRTPSSARRRRVRSTPRTTRATVRRSRASRRTRGSSVHSRAPATISTSSGGARACPSRGYPAARPVSRPRRDSRARRTARYAADLAGPRGGRRSQSPQRVRPERRVASARRANPRTTRRSDRSGWGSRTPTIDVASIETIAIASASGFSHGRAGSRDFLGNDSAGPSRRPRGRSGTVRRAGDARRTRPFGWAATDRERWRARRRGRREVTGRRATRRRARTSSSPPRVGDTIRARRTRRRTRVQPRRTPIGPRPNPRRSFVRENDTRVPVGRVRAR